MPEFSRFKAYLATSLIATIILIVGYFGILPKIVLEVCPVGFYDTGHATLCAPCRAPLGNNCISCLSQYNCTACSEQNYLDVGKCFSCAKSFPGCKYCTAAKGCLQC
jgi:hypothetical protein